MLSSILIVTRQFVSEQDGHVKLKHLYLAETTTVTIDPDYIVQEPVWSLILARLDMLI